MIEIGKVQITPLSDGTFRLDGGAMFGVVPKPLWEKSSAPDEANRVLLAVRPLLIKTGDEVVLVDTGIGDKGDEKFRSIYSPESSPTLVESLSRAGVSPGDVTMVINTHLHFDHAGGNTERCPEGGWAPAFSRARYVVQRGELEAALDPNERTRASYRPEDFVPVKEAGGFELVEGEAEVAPGVEVFRTPGHNRDIQLVKITSGGRTAVYLSDTIPTAAHLNYPFIAGYDLYPLETLKAKKEIIERAAKDRWLLVFAHDPVHAAGFVEIDGTRPVLKPWKG